MARDAKGCTIAFVVRFHSGWEGIVRITRQMATASDYYEPFHRLEHSRLPDDYPAYVDGIEVNPGGGWYGYVAREIMDAFGLREEELYR